MGREQGDMVRGRGAEELAAVMWEAAPSFCPVCTLFCPDSKLQEELSALRETFSNLTVSTEAKVKEKQGSDVGGNAVELRNGAVSEWRP